MATGVRVAGILDGVSALDEAILIWNATGTAPEVGRMTAAGEPITWSMIEVVRPLVAPCLVAPAFDGARVPAHG